MMLDIYICEDNAKQRVFVHSFINDYCVLRSLDAAIAISCAEPREILTHFEQAQNPALFFLDIDLNTEINGIELAGRIRKQNKKAAIVFLTSHSELALLTLQYKVEALDFIIKDSPENIKRKIAECISLTYKRHRDIGAEKTIKLTVGDKIISLDMNEIIFIETTPLRHKLRLHTHSRVLEFNGELKAMEALLDQRFIRLHKSFIINRDRVLSVNKKESTVTMVNHSRCPISRNGKKLLG
ncbi:MAG: LytTR family DNA-binding domain-containing protein [Defluviitaleaceae bacterium]|nr:LytTR family DNA-binding domain-containing protein [Defluviitaleaceae bacterium]MCL2274167.1 LytTR family DNA-binding domain-containing protein [Defluviitaleaceae bacterium]